MKEFHSIVLSGGVFKGVAFLGCLKYLEENKLLSPISTYVGASSGSIIAFLTCLGYTPYESLESCKTAISRYVSHEISVDALLDIMSTMGVDDGSFVTDWLADCLFSKKQLRNINFRDFGKSTGKNLIVCASNITQKTMTFFSMDKTPDVDVIDAIRASISVPFIFTPKRIGDDVYVDAGLFNNFPIEGIEPTVFKDTLGIAINSGCFKCHPDDMNMFSYFRLMIEGLVVAVNTKPPEMLSKHMIINIEDEEDALSLDYDTMKLNVREELLEVYFKKGYDAMITLQS
jgi:predicted acylesterase/phospholipase RssA